MDGMGGSALWLLRMVLLAGGGWMTARGYGDAAMWEALVGAAISAGGAVWSWRARRAALLAEPPR